MLSHPKRGPGRAGSIIAGPVQKIHMQSQYLSLKKILKSLFISQWFQLNVVLCLFGPFTSLFINATVGQSLVN